VPTNKTHPEMLARQDDICSRTPSDDGYAAVTGTTRRNPHHRMLRLNLAAKTGRGRHERPHHEFPQDVYGTICGQIWRDQCLMKRTVQAKTTANKIERFKVEKLGSHSLQTSMRRTTLVGVD
jgi:hypothetical protein